MVQQRQCARELALDEIDEAAVHQEQHVAADLDHRAVGERHRIDAPAVAHDADHVGAGAHDGAGALGRGRVGARGGLVIGHPIERRMQRPEHLVGQAGFDLAHRGALEVRGRNAEGRLHACPDGSTAHVVVPLVELQMADPFVARRAAECLVQRRPEVVRQTHQRQLAYVTSVGAHAPLAESARGAGRHLARLEQQHLCPLRGQRPRRGHAVDSAADNHELRAHDTAPLDDRREYSGWARVPCATCPVTPCCSWWPTPVPASPDSSTR